MPELVMDLVQKAAPYLGSHGSTSPRLDAELLLAEVLACGRMDLYLQFDRPLLGEEVDRFRELCRRRAAGEPVAYIRGRREFMSLELEVSPAVLVPRPETEVLVGEAVRLLGQAGVGDGGSARVLDVGTGSGAIALVLASRFPGAVFVATDISALALEVAARNATRLGLETRVQFVETDLVAAIRGPFDLVVANLPYIDPGWPDAVTPEVAASEPAIALFAGEDGLDHFKRLLPALAGLLAPHGCALLEFDPRQLDPLLALARAHGTTRVLTDLAGRERVLVVER
ncbi:MAG: peptide chain release factor N(5)-glutamine methyltransferase [Candidatus Dormibacteria bacterium]